MPDLKRNARDGSARTIRNTSVLVLVLVLGCAVDRSGLLTVDGGTGGVDAPGVDAPGVDAPGVDAPGVDAPGVDAPGVDAPGMDAPMAMDAGTDGGTDAGLDGGPDAGPPDDWWDTDWGCRRRAVSLTHLRAHETVLALECCLLLVNKHTRHASISYSVFCLTKTNRHKLQLHSHNHIPARCYYKSQ